MLKGGIIINPYQHTQEKKDILIEKGIIKEVAESITDTGALKIDIEGKIVTPGLIDVHVHLREPGQTHKETIETALKSALMGGVTTLVCMPNSNPVADHPSIIEFIKNKADSFNLCKVLPAAAATKNCDGKEISSMDALKRAGAVAISDDGKPVANAATMRNVMEYASMLGLPVLSHCEIPELFEGGQMNEGPTSTKLGLKGIPNAAESIAIMRDIQLAKLTGASIHIQHVSTAEGVTAIERAKSEGLHITAEACPHHFIFDDSYIDSQYNTTFKVNPPLRDKSDVRKVIEGICNDTIEIIASDHAPHAEFEKNVEFQTAPFGIAGVQTLFSASYTALVKSGLLELEKLVGKMTAAPTKLLGLEESSITPGKQANLAVFDIETPFIYDAAKSPSLGKNTPFDQMQLYGKTIHVICHGRLVVMDEKGIWE